MTTTTISCIIVALIGIGFLAFRLFGKPKVKSEPDVVRVTRKSRAASAEAK